jgi:exopolyphosphatase/guanosine-5'-triphosphate,3'-diphosphate pyrophosphatase
MIAIDLGSNSCRIIEYDCKLKKTVCEFEALVKTADRLHESKLISPQAVERIISAIKTAQERMDFSSQLVRAVTTEAMRQANNRADVILEIYNSTGVLFELISGQKEADLTRQAVEHRLGILNKKSDSYVLMDIGGGSTELVFRFEQKIVGKSYRVGIVGVAQQCSDANEVKALLRKEMQVIQDDISDIYESYRQPSLLIATAGTPTTISAFLQGMDYQTYDPKRINGYNLTCKGITQAYDALMALSEEERSKYVGVGRENLIAAGILIVEAFYELLGFSDAIVIDDSLREGLAIAHCSQTS